MISTIKKIKKLGLLFSNYAWDASVPPFKAFNIFYGWNGSGKTTLSRLFEAIGGIAIPELEYEIEDEQGNTYKQGEPFPINIRVFNRDYVQRNVEVLKGRANTISILLGADNRNLLHAIEQDNKLLNGDPSDPTSPGKSGQLAASIKEKQQRETERGRQFTEIAKTIGAAIGGNALRDYRKQQAEKDFGALTAKAELSNENLEKKLLSVKQESLPSIQRIVLPTVKGEANEEIEIPSLLKKVQQRATTLLLQTVDSEVIARLAENTDVSQWVEQGIRLHEKHSSRACEYCLQKIPATRIEQLARHFNEADKKLKDDLDMLDRTLKTIHAAIASLVLVDESRLYSSLRPSFAAARSAFERDRQKMLTSLESCLHEIREKKTKTTEAVVLTTSIEAGAILNQIDLLNEIISTHNRTTDDFDQVKKDAASDLKTHYLSTVYDKVKKLDHEIDEQGAKADGLQKQVAEIRARIASNMAGMSSEHKACEVLNEKLTTFLGHGELKFIPRITKTEKKPGVIEDVVAGYDIVRGNEPALYLSEGEQSAIAFVYFIVHLADGNFDTQSGIVLIDDPVSSLDSNSLYQAFSFLKNSVKECKQVFVFTHNFDFLKLVINWRRRCGGAGYYMVKNHFAGDVRCAYIDRMDKELSEYESEYHYLFKLLRKLQDEQDGTIAKAYPVPNIARKVWDTFLTFRVPNGETPYKKMDDLKTAGFDAQKLDAIYKFTNDQSHITGSGFDPALVPETKKVVGEMFEMMEKISPKHYAILSNSIA